MANRQQNLRLRCLNASRGCTAEVSHAALLSHHEKCDFASVECSYDGCTEQLNRKDLVSHQQNCEFRSLTCGDCREVMKKREYKKHSCVLLKEVNKNKQSLTELHRIFRELEAEQLRHSNEIQRLAGRELKETNESQRQQVNRQDQSVFFRSLSVGSSPMEVDTQIVVACGGDKSCEVFNWSTQQWAFYKDAFFFDHTGGFSFVYNSKMMFCGGRSTNRVEFLATARNRSSITFPVQLPENCGKGVLCGDKIYTFASSISETLLKPSYMTKVCASYELQEDFSFYNVVCVNENSIFLVGSVTFVSHMHLECADVLLYKPGTSHFQKQAPLPYAVEDMAVVAYKDNFIILGGINRSKQYLNDVLIYNTTSQQCGRLPSMLEKRARCAAVMMGDTIIAIGGTSKSKDGRGYTSLKTAEYLVLGEETWKSLPPMNCERAGATALLAP
ncbi:uncharacterized protein LOC114530057 [Dendronephthya gigantea]|uniref:uncharacterized protein LOC114530057 n=1 Tax=Dendronephthya gigantea TaxID=151771 RepID=UPI00106D6B4B|nr:uncharacterized protein LOC114530057 [Dendronephthya gigantea]